MFFKPLQRVRLICWYITDTGGGNQVFNLLLLPQTGILPECQSHGVPPLKEIQSDSWLMVNIWLTVSAIAPPTEQAFNLMLSND